MMSQKIKKSVIIVFFITLYLVFLSLKIIITFSNSGFVDYNARNAARIENIISLKSIYSFIAVGDIQNSHGVFEKKLIPLINRSNADFIVLLGDTVLDGANDKYAAFYRSLLKINKPVLFAIGDTEISDGGIKNYFRHVGAPLFFFIAGQSEFIFLDTTGYTEEKYQINWLKDLLDNVQNVSNRFVFMNRSLIMNTHTKGVPENKYTMTDSYKRTLRGMFTAAGVSAVISSSNGIFDKRTAGRVLYLSTGGGGGAPSYQNTDSFFHCTEIRVEKGNVSVSLLKPDTQNLSEGLSFLDYVWNKIYSWVYVHFINVILIISLFFLVVYSLYTKLVERIDYYPDFYDPVKKDYPLKIVMFTNNYLPFIGGVPLSLSRLKRGLESRGHKVYIFAPDYGTVKGEENEDDVIRCAPLFHYKKGGLIVPVSNIFSSRIRKTFKKIDPDIVHVHHPFWLGSVGKRLAEKYRKPVVFTYHTRLEQYNHNVPIFHQLAGGQIPHLLIKHFAAACDAVVAPTRTAKRYLRNLGIGKLIIIQPTGVDLDRYVFPSSGKRPEEILHDFVLFTVFRLSEEKNPYFLLEGIEKLAKVSSVPFTCLIAGTGPEEEAMKEYIRHHHLQKYVTMLGKVDPDDIPRYYTKADLFIFASRSETQGMVILEAMAGGTPVVAVDSSGISDIVENGVNGYKTEPVLDAWVEKIKFLMEDEKERKNLSKGALRTAHENSIESMSVNILDMYYEIIDWKKKHPNQTFIR